MPGKQEEGQGAPGGGSSSTVCLWVVTVLLFVSLLGGGACLAAYILLPPHEAPPAWLPAVGLALVGLPWAFWIITCVYRCARARAAERRMAVAPAPGSMCSRSGS